MNTLLIRLAGPMQSWGTQSRFVDRDTSREPSKSGVVGLICAALGKPRQETPGDGFPSLEELASLRMGVRVDREGVLLKDYHTAGGGWIPAMAQLYFPKRKNTGNVGVVRADSSSGDTVVSNRYYLSDAAFIVGLEADDNTLLSRLHDALLDPVWPASLGRKSFVPGLPLNLPSGSLVNMNLEDALAECPWTGTGNVPEMGLRMVIEDTSGDEVRSDQPACYEFDKRTFGLRRVRLVYLPVAKVKLGEVESCISQG